MQSPSKCNRCCRSFRVIHLDTQCLQKPVVEVLRGASRAKLPEPGSIVIARITKINPRLASARLLCINTQPLGGTFTGIIRYATGIFLLADEAWHSMKDRRSPCKAGMTFCNQ